MSDERRAPVLRGPLRPARLAQLGLARPVDILEGTRWLFWVLAMISLAISTPAPLLASRGVMSVVAVVSLAALGVSITTGYLARQAHWSWDLADAVLLVALACAGPSPAAILSALFALVWFRSLYGSTRAALVRGVLYGAALVATVALWPLVPGHTGSTEPMMVVGALPTMFVTIVAGRHLAAIAHDREQATHRDAIHASAGSRLLGVTDAAEIRRIASQAATEICAATPGLRLLNVVSDGPRLRVTGHLGEFVEVPTTLSSDVSTVLDPRGAGAAAPTRVPELDAAVGVTCSWSCVVLPDRKHEAWLFVGSSQGLPPQVLDTLTSLVNQVTLAMRNSQAHLDLTAQATLDSLTGLANRALFHTTLAATLADADADATETAVLFVDLDDFKDVNDVFGHAAGDEVLREVAARLRRTTRPDDVCARLGGDEFAVLLRGTPAGTATEVGRRIVSALAGPMPLPAGTTYVGASVGLAVAIGELAPEQLIQRADIAMYAAKAAGKGRVQLFTPGLLQGDSLQVSLDRQLAGAAAQGELVVLYQPVVSLSDGLPTAVEALVRWQHPQRGLLAPAEFIPAAERTGAIRDIGMYVLRRACADLAQWRLTWPSAPLAMHVNVSALQLDDEHFTSRVLHCLEEFSVQPGQLVLEVTETVVISSPAAIDQLDELAAHGVLIAIDDFGTGYSALTTLRSLPVTIVKIDASFVAGSTVNAEDRAVTEAVVQMATRMGLRTIAEGVERPDQQALLQSLGADAAQGYHYLRPATVDQLTVWLGDHLPASAAWAHPAGHPVGGPRGNPVVPLASRRSAGR